MLYYAYNPSESWCEYPVTKEATGSQQTYVDMEDYHGNMGQTNGLFSAMRPGRGYTDNIIILRVLFLFIQMSLQVVFWVPTDTKSV